MNSKNELSRITIDIPKTLHRKLKTRAATLGKSMREMVIDAINLTEECSSSDHIPNKKTIKAIEDAAKGKGLTRGTEAEEIEKKLGF